jgi:hypothetical protein
MSDFLDPKKNFSILGKLAVVAVALLITIYVFYQFSSQKGKDAINITTSNIGFGTQVIPWVDRADTMTRKIIERNSEKLAGAIQGITHPSGKEPTLDGVRVSKLNNRILVEINTSWKGGFLGTDYETKVAWEFSEERHESAKVTFDQAPTPVARKNAEMLNDYFRTRIYPVLLKDMGS